MNDKETLQLQRIVGGAMILAGLAFGYFSVYQPLQSAARHVANLSVSMKSVAVTPLLLVGGIVFLLFPQFTLKHLGGFQSSTPKTPVGWAFLVTIILMGFGFWFFVQGILRSQGYSV